MRRLSVVAFFAAANLLSLGFFASQDHPDRFTTLAPGLTSSLNLNNSVYVVNMAPGAQTVAPVMSALFIVRNTTQPIALTFGTTQRYDFIIQNANGDIVYRWSDGKAFGQLALTENFGPGEMDFVVQVPLTGADTNPLPAGTYTAHAYLTNAGPRAFAASAGFNVQWAY
jgi:hypothetical protein